MREDRAGDDKMRTELVRIEKGELYTPDSKEKLARAAELIRAGEVVAFPTETVYGLGANGMDADASVKIYEAKGRPSDNPLILHIAEFDQLEDIARDISENAWKIMKAFWPGPMWGMPYSASTVTEVTPELVK